MREALCATSAVVWHRKTAQGGDTCFHGRVQMQPCKYFFGGALAALEFQFALFEFAHLVYINAKHFFANDYTEFFSVAVCFTIDVVRDQRNV